MEDLFIRVEYVLSTISVRQERGQEIHYNQKAGPARSAISVEDTTGGHGNQERVVIQRSADTALPISSSHYVEMKGRREGWREETSVDEGDLYVCHFHSGNLVRI